MSIKRAIDSINEKILIAVKNRHPDVIVNPSLTEPRLVAVSKLKPITDILQAYEGGQRHFGENYIQELEEKSISNEISISCPDIMFHFIGHLQTNKVNKLMKVKRLYVVETIDSIKLADAINNAISRQDATGDGHSFVGDRLKVMIQVNTSGEEQKNGIEPNAAPELADHIVTRCTRLQFAGLMTIGRLGGWPDDRQPNRDFSRLYDLRGSIAHKLGLDPMTLELSMGMSSDFEEAVRMGSTSVRVGSLIFGERPSRVQS